MNNIDVLLIPEEIAHKELDNKLVVVVDILRASSTIVTALAQGCKRFIPIFSINEARNVVNDLKKEEVLLCGERKGVKIQGFDLGNSPCEYTRKIVKDKKIVFTTSNGVKTMEMIGNTSKIIICSFLNLKAICNYCLNFNGDIVVVCSGKNGMFSLEDAVCAGMLFDSLKKKSLKLIPETDANITVQTLYKKYANNILRMLKNSQHGQFLEGIGLESDLEYCSSVDVFNIVPILKDKMIINGS